MAYLADLTLRLNLAARQLPEDLRRRHVDFLAAQQRPDGGFAGREGDSDLYYTGFALRGLALLNALDRHRAERTGEFLRTHLDHEMPLVDFLSLLFGVFLIGASTGIDLMADRDDQWLRQVDAHLEQFRRSDGGYARTKEGASSSTYHTFLVAITREMLGLPLTAPERLARFVVDRRREDGGFVEIGPMRRSGTNPTAAAIAVLKMAGGLEEPIRRTAIGFLTGMQTDQGGFLANTRIPLPDLLSTYTAVQTLIDLETPHDFRHPSMADYLGGLEAPDGGFRAAVWDDATDVEYTFYGVATWAL
ncbi:MAG: prenyltransferase/squalene oxidase repeat-containing protein, partial [Pirellulales bacterium]